jgi:hypothetical protein
MPTRTARYPMLNPKIVSAFKEWLQKLSKVVPSAAAPCPAEAHPPGACSGMVPVEAGAPWLYPVAHASGGRGDEG